MRPGRSGHSDDEHRTAETSAPYEHEVTWPNYKEASAYLARLRADAPAGRASRLTG